MIRRMLREEWRMHSTLYRGSSFATFPLVVLVFSLCFSHLTLNYSTLPASSLGLALHGMGAFIGIAVGTMGFSSRDAMKNVLGPVNFLLYSSRTLPVSERRLLLDFIVKDIIYYSLFFLLPLALGVLVLEPKLIFEAALMPAWFLAGLSASFLAARSSKALPSFSPGYQDIGLSPLADKSVVDLTRSSGGFLKIIFSLAILTGFYWFAVLNFPTASKLLENPLLSFGVMLGTLNLSVYNWLNRFDSFDEYSHLPVQENDLLKAKEKAYMTVSVPLTVTVLLACFLVFGGRLLLALYSGLATTLFTLLLAVKLTGLEPNERIFETRTFLEFLAANILVVVPLLILSVIYSSNLLPHYFAATSIVLLASFKKLGFKP